MAGRSFRRARRRFEQAWIDSPLGEQVDTFLDTTFGEIVIGNTAPGTEADPTGGAGRLLFGGDGDALAIENVSAAAYLAVALATRQ